MASRRTCKRCSAIIPEGRNYCDAHYAEALDEYHEAYIQYERNLSHWQNMSSVERNRAHRRTEDVSVGSNAIILGVIIGGVAWFLLNTQIVWWMGCCLVLGVPFVIVKIPLLEQIVGRFARTLFVTIQLIITFGIIGFIVSFFVESLQENLETMFKGIVLGSVLYAIYAELSGGNHASGAPSRPIRPEP